VIQPMTALQRPASALPNPFASDAARAHSSYHGTHGGDLVRLLDAAPVSPFARVAHDAFRGFCLDDTVTEGLARDLYAFTAERQGFESDFTTFVAVFREREPGDELAFERTLWSQLQRLHDLDAGYHPWDARVSDDPESPKFSFSVAGDAFFVIGMHPGASRSARRFAWPTLVFNAHEQFENLRADGRFEPLQSRIRERELRLDGRINPNLSDYGYHSEARQYSGRPTEPTWTCPFRPRRG